MVKAKKIHKDANVESEKQQNKIGGKIGKKNLKKEKQQLKKLKNVPVSEVLLPVKEEVNKKSKHVPDAVGQTKVKDSGKRRENKKLKKKLKAEKKNNVADAVGKTIVKNEVETASTYPVKTEEIVGTVPGLNLEAKRQSKKLKKKLKAENKKNDAEAIGQTKVKEEVKQVAKHPVKTEEIAGSAAGLDSQKNRQNKKLKKKLKTEKEEGKTEKTVSGPGQTIFVGNVPSNTKRVQLLKLFTPYGKVKTIRFRTANGKVIFKHKARKESLTLNAYVVFDNSEAATKALELNGATLKNQILRVEKPENKHHASDKKNTIFVGNLKNSATDDQLHQIFSSCGEIEYIRTLQSANGKGCNGTAFVCFKSPDAVSLALELKGTILEDRPIHVERYSVKKLGANNKRIAENGDSKVRKPFEKKTQNSGKKHISKKIQVKKDQDDKKKKSEFRGVKSEKMKKKLNKKIPSQMKRLANKIAPKD